MKSQIALATIKAFDDYMQTGDEKSLNDVHPAQLRPGDEFVIAGEGWNWVVKVVQ